MIESVQFLKAGAVHVRNLGERSVLQQSTRDGLQSIGEGLHQGLAEEAVVVGQGNLRGFFRSLDENAQGELGSILRNLLFSKNLSVNLILLNESHLVGHHYGRMEIARR